MVPDTAMNTTAMMASDVSSLSRSSLLKKRARSSFELDTLSKQTIWNTRAINKQPAINDLTSHYNNCSTITANIRLLKPLPPLSPTLLPKTTWLTLSDDDIMDSDDGSNSLLLPDTWEMESDSGFSSSTSSSSSSVSALKSVNKCYLSNISKKQRHASVTVNQSNKYSECISSKQQQRLYSTRMEMTPPQSPNQPFFFTEAAYRRFSVRPITPALKELF
ncbi:hypothetical protein BDF19DRAFT_442783 [Syncephalis fuscata]|nr:hypothetical protein BDF19DRAFT_442783 [Syncephalis fuscata]